MTNLPTYKVCIKCNEYKLLNEFYDGKYNNKTGKYSKQSKCKECYKQYNKQRKRDIHEREKLIKTINKYMKKRKNKITKKELKGKNIKELKKILDALEEEQVQGLIKNKQLIEKIKSNKEKQEKIQKPWKDPESLFCDKEFLTKPIKEGGLGIDIRKCDEV